MYKQKKPNYSRFFLKTLEKAFFLNFKFGIVFSLMLLMCNKVGILQDSKLKKLKAKN